MLKATTGSYANVSAGNVPFVPAGGQGAIPIIDAPTGSMANNGAITLGTALLTTYASCYLVLPANAISAGSSAGIYYATMSSTTVGTVFNNTYTSGMPTIPASPTAFATTGPGAFTGNTSADTVLTISIPAGAMGANGSLRIVSTWAFNNTAGAKTYTTQFGGTTYAAPSGANGSYEKITVDVHNRGDAAKQVGGSFGVHGASTAIGNGNPIYATVNTANAQNVTLVATKATATDVMVLESYRIEVLNAP